MEQQLARIADILNGIQGSLVSISLCLWLMLIVKDMGHDASNAINSWRTEWKK